MARIRSALLAALVAALAGCASAGNHEIDQLIAQQAARLQALDIDAHAAPTVARAPGADVTDTKTPLPPDAAPAAPDRAELVVYQAPSAGGKGGAPAKPYDTKQPDGSSRLHLEIPSGLPGAEAPTLRIPENPEERKRYIERLFPALPALEPPLAVAPGPEGRPMTLADLQRLGLLYSPAIKKAVAAVQAARGAMQDVGAYPNPTFGYEHDTIQTGPAGYFGFLFDQLIKTGNKLKLRQAAAAMDLLNAEAALRRARSDLFYQIRTAYFAYLVAAEAGRLSEALARFIDEIYRAQISLLRGNFAAAYEPMQLRPLALQARLTLVQARNQQRAAWRQLAAALGLPDMPPSEVAGRADMPVPEFDYDRVLKRVLRYHTDVITAENSVRQAQFNLAFEKISVVPDVDVRLLLQKDYTTQPSQIAASIVTSFQLPVWDQNRGGIMQQRGNLASANANLPLTRNNLTNTLADAFNRYETTRQQVAVSLRQVEDQVRVYRGVYDRRQSLPGDVGFGDVVVAQQTLVSYLANYATALGLQWTAVADVANLLQSDDLYDTADMPPAAATPPGPGCAPPPTRAAPAAPSPPEPGKGAPPPGGTGVAPSNTLPAPRPAERFGESRPADAPTPVTEPQVPSLPPPRVRPPG